MIRIGAKKETSPLGFLNDCHRRIERFLYVLITIVRQSQGGELNESQRNAMEAALRYFREAAPKHTLDEEDSLFPRMRAVSLVEELSHLEHDHRSVEQSHDEVDVLGRRWLERGSLSAEETDRLRQSLSTLSSSYHKHIRLEEQYIFPLACRILPRDQLEAIQREMSARRA